MDGNHYVNNKENNSPSVQRRRKICNVSIHVMDKCLLEDESWQVGRKLALGGIFHIQHKGNKSLDSKTIK